MSEKFEVDRDALRRRLTPMQWHVTQESGTEPPGSGAYTESAEPGSYVCVVCGETLFEAGEKFHSACGWPAFGSNAAGTIRELEDRTHGMVRTEVRCRRCDAHLGHVFPDGPPPTGLRYCINSAAIEHVPSDGG